MLGNQIEKDIQLSYEKVDEHKEKAVLTKKQKATLWLFALTFVCTPIRKDILNSKDEKDTKHIGNPSHRVLCPPLHFVW